MMTLADVLLARAAEETREALHHLLTMHAANPVVLGVRRVEQAQLHERRGPRDRSGRRARTRRNKARLQALRDPRWSDARWRTL